MNQFWLSFAPQDKHKHDLEDVLIAKAMPAIGSIMAVNEGLKQTLQKYNALAAQVCLSFQLFCLYLRNVLNSTKQIPVI